MARNNVKQHISVDICDLRKFIDDIDEKILNLVNHRLLIAMRIGQLKQQRGDRIIDHAREKDIISRLESKNPGLLPNPDLKRILSILISASRAIQEKCEEGKNKIDSNLSLEPLVNYPGRFDVQTTLLGVIGDPVSHSLSPVMHNRAMQVTGYNGAYLAFRVRDLDSAVKGLRALNIKGVSVTIPHKVAIMNHLDDVDELGKQIGAVNTICNDRGYLIGYNTDSEAALSALAEKTEVKGKTVAIVGAGGAAKAIGFGIIRAGARPIIYNRSKAKGEALAAYLGADFRPLSEFDGAGCDILINTTSVGMWPDTDKMVVPETAIHKGTIVMDIVYNPTRTKLLQAAERQDAIPIDGITMFVLQGARQFELWTGKKAPINDMRMAVLGSLREGCT